MLSSSSSHMLVVALCHEHAPVCMCETTATTGNLQDPWVSTCSRWRSAVTHLDPVVLISVEHKEHTSNSSID